MSVELLNNHAEYSQTEKVTSDSVMGVLKNYANPDLMPLEENAWAEAACEKHTELFIDETDYLSSVPGMVDVIKDGMNTPLSECVPLSEVWSNV